MIMRNVPHRRRAGISLLELQVALVLFGIALAGLGPLVVMHLKQLKRLENRLSDTSTYYLTPSSDAWARKLGAAAAISSAASEPADAASPASPTNNIEILSVDKSFAGEEVTVQVSVTAVPP